LFIDLFNSLDFTGLWRETKFAPIIRHFYPIADFELRHKIAAQPLDRQLALIFDPLHGGPDRSVVARPLECEFARLLVHAMDFYAVEAIVLTLVFVGIVDRRCQPTSGWLSQSLPGRIVFQAATSRSVLDRKGH